MENIPSAIPRAAGDEVRQRRCHRSPEKRAAVKSSHPGKAPSRKIRSIFAALALLATFYYLIVSLFYWGRLDRFGCLAVASGLLFSVCCIAHDRLARVFRKVPVCLVLIFRMTVIAMCASFLVIEWAIISRMSESAKPGADIVLVLGCQVNGTIPSGQLTNRVKVAIRYLKENERTKVVVTGGQGPGEDISEAESMKGILLRNGIDAGRILMEDRAANTMENFRFSDEKFGLADQKVLVVTTDYHMYRALSLARKFNYRDVESLPSRSLPLAIPVHVLREYAAVVYYMLLGRI
jgi:uncharacterized SAM-binding protein YcdF (DUF218 family)